MHFASSLAVYEVTAAAAKRMTMPHSQPAYFMPIGRLKRPTPIRTLEIQISKLNLASVDSKRLLTW